MELKTETTKFTSAVTVSTSTEVEGGTIAMTMTLTAVDRGALGIGWTVVVTDYDYSWEVADATEGAVSLLIESLSYDGWEFEGGFPTPDSVSSKVGAALFELGAV